MLRRNLIIKGIVARALWYSVAVAVILHVSVESFKVPLSEKFDDRGSKGF